MEFINWVLGDGLPYIIIIFAWMVVSFGLSVAEQKKIIPWWVSWVFTALCVLLLALWYIVA